MNLKRVLLAGLCLATVVFTPAHLPSCGPFFPEAVFTTTSIPPLPDYFQGRLGVLQPSFTQKYLWVAYRYLSAQPLSPAEVDSLASPANPGNAPPEESVWTGSSFADSAVKEWLDTRSRIPGLGPQRAIQTYRNDTASTGEWRYFLNCTGDAFKKAAETLEERIKMLGADDPGIKSWGTAQDVVFSNCAKGEAIPLAADPRMPQVLKYDRAYQIAAAHFYAEHYDTAAAMFRDIAADAASPWSAIAPYLAVRCYIRKATVPRKYGVFDKDALREADRGLQAILKDGKRASLHGIAARLAAFVSLRLDPLDHIRTLAERLQRQAGSRDFRQDLTDYLYLLNHFNLQPGFTPDSTRQTSDMTDWILTFSSGNPARALERWKTTDSAAWLVAAISKLHARDADAAAAMTAAAKIAENSPAFATARYHLIRLLMEAGDDNGARANLDAMLPGLRSALPNSSLNLFLAQRMSLARNFEEFLEFAPRIPEEILYAQDPEDKTPLFDADSTAIFNRALPLKDVARAAVSDRLPPERRIQLLRAAWVRAALISDNTAAELAGELERRFPEVGHDLEAWRAARDVESRHFALAIYFF